MSGVFAMAAPCGSERDAARVVAGRAAVGALGQICLVFKVEKTLSGS